VVTCAARGRATDPDPHPNTPPDPKPDPSAKNVPLFVLARLGIFSLKPDLRIRVAGRDQPRPAGSSVECVDSCVDPLLDDGRVDVDFTRILGEIASTAPPDRNIARV
jgi:hypothetical protein